VANVKAPSNQQNPMPLHLPVSRTLTALLITINLRPNKTVVITSCASVVALKVMPSANNVIGAYSLESSMFKSIFSPFKTMFFILAPM
jgi:hypothetical protein